MDKELELKLARRLLTSNSSNNTQEENVKPVKKRQPGIVQKKVFRP